MHDRVDCRQVRNGLTWSCRCYLGAWARTWVCNGEVRIDEEAEEAEEAEEVETLQRPGCSVMMPIQRGRGILVVRTGKEFV
jgi:hypothetical protein